MQRMRTMKKLRLRSPRNLQPFPHLGNCIAAVPVGRDDDGGGQNEMHYCSLLPDAADAVVVASLGRPSTHHHSNSREASTTTTQASAAVTTTTTTTQTTTANSTGATNSAAPKSTTTTTRESLRTRCREVAVRGEFSLPGLQSASPAQVSQAWCRLESATGAAARSKYTAICVVGFNQQVRVFEVVHHHQPRAGEAAAATTTTAAAAAANPGSAAAAAAAPLPSTPSSFQPVCKCSMFWKIRSVAAGPAPPPPPRLRKKAGESRMMMSGSDLDVDVLRDRGGGARRRVLIGLGGPCGVAVNVFCAATSDFVSPKWSMLSPRCNVVATQSSACGRLLAAISAAAHVLVWRVDSALRCESDSSSSIGATNPASSLAIDCRVVLHAKIRRVLRVTCIAFSPDSSCVAFGCWNDDAEEKGKWGRSGQVFVFRHVAPQTYGKRTGGGVPSAGRLEGQRFFSPSSVDYFSFGGSQNMRHHPSEASTSSSSSSSSSSSADPPSSCPEWICVGHTGCLEPDGETCAPAADGQLSQPEEELNFSSSSSSVRARATATATVGGVWIPSPTLVAWTPDSRYIVVGNGIDGSMGTFLVGDTNLYTLNAVQLVSILAHRLRLSGIASTSMGVLTWASDGEFQLFPWHLLRPMASAIHARSAAKVQRLLVSCGLSHTAHLVEVEDGCAENRDSQCRHQPPAHNAAVLRHRVVVLCRVVRGRRPFVFCKRFDLPPVTYTVASSVSSVEAAYDRWSSDCLLPAGTKSSTSKLDFLAWDPSASAPRDDDSLHALFRHLRVRSIEAWRGLQPDPQNCAPATVPEMDVCGLDDSCNARDQVLWLSTHRSWFCAVARPFNTAFAQHEEDAEMFVSMVSPSQTVLYLAAAFSPPELSSDGAPPPPPSLTPRRQWAALASNTPIFRSAVVFASKDTGSIGAALLILVRAPNLLSLFSVPMPRDSQHHPQHQHQHQHQQQQQQPDAGVDAGQKSVRKVFETEIPGLRQCHHDLQVCTCSLVNSSFASACEGELPRDFGGWGAGVSLPNTQRTVLFLQGNDANMPCHSALLWVLETPSCGDLNSEESAVRDAAASAGTPGPISATLLGPWIVQDLPTATRLHFVACFAIHDAPPRDTPQGTRAVSSLQHVVLAFTMVAATCVETSSSRSSCCDDAGRRRSPCGGGGASVILFVPGRDHWTHPVPVSPPPSEDEDGGGDIANNCFDKPEQQDFPEGKEQETRFMRALLLCVRSELAKLNASPLLKS